MFRSYDQLDSQCIPSYCAISACAAGVWSDCFDIRMSIIHGVRQDRQILLDADSTLHDYIYTHSLTLQSLQRLVYEDLV